MRLGKMNELLAMNLPMLSLQVEQSPRNWLIKNVMQTRNAAIALIQIKALEKSGGDLIGCLPITGREPGITVSHPVSQEIMSKFGEFKRECEQLSKLLAQAIEPALAGTIYFKIPEAHDLGDVAASISKLKECFDQLLSGRSEAPQIVFKGFDTGTEWLVLFVAANKGTDFLLKLMNGVMDIAARVQKHKKENIELRRAEAATQVFEAQAKYQVAVIETFQKNLAEDTIKHFGIDPKDPKSIEELNRAVRAIAGLTELFSRGANLDVPQITAPKEPNASAGIAKTSGDLHRDHEELKLLESGKSKKKDD